jgi:hypothetical protein
MLPLWGGQLNHGPRPNLLGINEVETVLSEVILTFFFVPFEHSIILLV